MVKEEMAVLLIAMQAMYPNWAKDLTVQQAEGMIMVWHDLLGEYPYELVKTAVRSMAATTPYPPSIAEVISQIQNLTQTEKPMSEVEAWGLVKKAIRNSAYNSQSEFEKLPEIIQKTIGSADVLRSWAMEESDNTDKVTGSNFMRSFRGVQEREKQYKMLPNDVKQLMSNATKLIGN